METNHCLGCPPASSPVFASPSGRRWLPTLPVNSFLARPHGAARPTWRSSSPAPSTWLFWSWDSPPALCRPMTSAPPSPSAAAGPGNATELLELRLHPDGRQPPRPSARPQTPQHRREGERSGNGFLVGGKRPLPPGPDQGLEPPRRHPSRPCVDQVGPPGSGQLPPTACPGDPIAAARIAAGRFVRTRAPPWEVLYCAPAAPSRASANANPPPWRRGSNSARCHLTCQAASPRAAASLFKRGCFRNRRTDWLATARLCRCASTDRIYREARQTLAGELSEAEAIVLPSGAPATSYANASAPGFAASTSPSGLEGQDCWDKGLKGRS